MRFFPFATALLLAGTTPLKANESAVLPACAERGASSVFFNGKPALKMSDVVNCPPELVDIIPGVTIEGQPMVHLRSGKSEQQTCITKGSPDIAVSGKSAQTMGDAGCKPAK